MTPPPQPANRPPAFSSAAAVSVAENTTTVVRVRATDRDSQDTVTGYAIRGGADSGKFSIVAATGELSFTTAPDFENPADAGANNEYVVAVRATSGAGGRARTATQTIRVTVDSLTYKVTVGPDVADGQHTFSGGSEKLSGTDHCEASRSNLSRSGEANSPRPAAGVSASRGSSASGGISTSAGAYRRAQSSTRVASILGIIGRDEGSQGELCARMS